MNALPERNTEITKHADYLGDRSLVEQYQILMGKVREFERTPHTVSERDLLLTELGMDHMTRRAIVFGVDKQVLRTTIPVLHQKFQRWRDGLLHQVRDASHLHSVNSRLAMNMLRSVYSRVGTFSRQEALDVVENGVYDPLCPERGAHFIGFFLYSMVLADIQHRTKIENKTFMERVSTLMRNKDFLINVAQACDEAYKRSVRAQYTARGESIPEYLKEQLFDANEIRVLRTNGIGIEDEDRELYDLAQEKLAINTAGFYALQEGLGTLALLKHTSHFDVLKAIVKGTLTPQERETLCRFSHATWAALQPHRGRETRPVMQLFDTLPPSEQKKDFDQIRAAAQVLYIQIGLIPEYANKL